jgi:uncharacterized protein YbjT (DUF2867 family)
MNKILVLGGTGMLGAPVARRLQADGFEVRLMVRDPKKARGLFGNSFEIMAGDVADLSCLEEALEGCQGVHITIGGPVDQLSAENVADLAPRLGLERVTYVSGATAFEQNRWFPMTEQKLNAETAVRGCGLPFTIFCPTWPMEQLPRLAMGGRPMIIGNRPVLWHWFAADDLARLVSNAYQREKAINQRLFIHGPEAMSMVEAVKRYCQAFHPEVEAVTMMPIDAARAMADSTGNDMLKFFADLMAYFDKVGEMGDPTEANQLLGIPEITLDEWIEKRKDTLA